MFAAGVRCGAALLAMLLLDPHHAASAMDAATCAAIREELRSAHQSQNDAQARLAEIKPRLDSLSKQIDDLSVQEANEFIATGRTSEITERRLAQLRAEYKAVSQSKEYRDLQSTVKRMQDVILVNEAKSQREGCSPDTSSASGPAPGLEGPFEHEITFQDDSKKFTLLMKTRKEYNGLSITSSFALFFITAQLSITCPPWPDGVFLTYHRAHEYDCDYSRRMLDPNNKLVGTEQGKADVKLTLERNHKSQLVISLKQGALVTDLSRDPPQRSRTKSSTITLWEETGFK